MLHKLIGAIPLVLLLTASAMAQVRLEPGPSLQRRAQRLEPSLQKRAQQLEPFILEAAKRYGIDPRILRIICFLESRYRIGAVSPKGARGPMQFMPDTARRFGLVDPHDPRASFDAAARYLRILLRRFGGRLDLALAAYNSGEGTVESFKTGRPLVLASGKIINPRKVITGGLPPYRETREYVKSAIALYTNGRLRQNLNLNLPDNLNPSNNRAHASVTRVEKVDRGEKTPSLFIEVQ